MNSKWTIDQNVKCKIQNIGGNVDGLGYDDDFLAETPKAQSMKEMIDKLDFIKIKNY